MLGRMILILVAVLILILFICVLFGGDFIKNIRKGQNKITRKMKEIKESKEVTLVNGPTLRITKKDGDYDWINVDKNEFKIGSGKKNDLVLESKTVEEKHAVLYKRFKEDTVYYELVNYAKTNPVEYYNKYRGKFEYLGFNDGVELEEFETFYIGNFKVRVTIPVLTHKPSGTEAIKMNPGKEAIPYNKNKDIRMPSERIVRKDEIDI